MNCFLCGGSLNLKYDWQYQEYYAKCTNCHKFWACDIDHTIKNGELKFLFIDNLWINGCEYHIAIYFETYNTLIRSVRSLESNKRNFNLRLNYIPELTILNIKDKISKYILFS